MIITSMNLFERPMQCHLFKFILPPAEPVAPLSSYLQTGMSALILELWYRFVWMKYTVKVHAAIMKRYHELGEAAEAEGDIVDAARVHRHTQTN